MNIMTRVWLFACLVVPITAHGELVEPRPGGVEEWEPLYTHNLNTAGDEGREPNLEKMSQLLTNSADGKDIMLFVGGKLKDEFFVYNRCFTLRDDYGDQDDFIRHKLQLDSTIVQGLRKYGKPASQAAVRLTNYMLWQDAGNYTPLYIDKLELPGADNAVLANDIQVKSVLPLLFVEEAWFKLNFGTFAKPCKGQDTFLKIGYFPYQVGRGVSMGLHGDLAVDYLGWGGEGGYTRFPAAPPGILWHQEINKKLSVDAYFNLWRETNASIVDTQKTTQQQLMDGSQPQRGSGKDTWSFALRADYLMEDEDAGSALLQPYGVYTRAPEQMIEVLGDARSDLFTVGTMVDWKKNNLTINIEAAIQFGHQEVLPLDRNTYRFGAGSSGALTRGFSHIQQIPTAVGLAVSSVAERSFQAAGDETADDGGNEFLPTDNLSQVVLTDSNRNFAISGPDKLLTTAGRDVDVVGGYNLFNSNIFGNSRFRKGYRLENRGVMFMADAIYDFEDQPISVAGTIGYISGDNYPYNDETSRIFRGFIPQRSRYRGYGVKNWMMFERQIIPRPINISYRTLSAYNNLKDLSNLQFFGIGATWFPFKKRSRGHVGADVMVLGEVASLNKWDVNGEHPDPAIELQLKRLRNAPLINAGPPPVYGPPTLFSGWESAENASRYLGFEIDLRAHYQVLENCDLIANLSFFVPGTLYSDLKGQPNILTQRIDKDGYLRYDSLGDKTAMGFMIGFHYAF